MVAATSFQRGELVPKRKEFELEHSAASEGIAER
jgi:hypothetical protein